MNYKKLIAVASLALATVASVDAAGQSPEKGGETAGDASVQLSGLLDEHWQWWLAANPFEATSLGVRDYDDQVPDISLEAADRRAAQAEAFLKRLGAISDAELTAADRTNKAVLAWQLRREVSENSFGQRTMLFTSYSSWPQGFAQLGNGLPFFKRADFESYLNRLGQYPALNAQAMAVTAKALADGQVQPCSTLTGAARAFRGPVQGPVEETPFFAPFKRAKPSDMNDADWSKMKQWAAAIIRDTLTPEYNRFADWYEQTYLPNCRKSDSASALPGGKLWYEDQIRKHTTTNLSAAEIHHIGIAENKRIAARMDQIAGEAGYASRKDYLAKLKSDPRYFAKSADELLREAAWEAKRIDGLMPQYFKTLPRNPYGVKPIPAETAEGTTTAYYMPGAPASGIAGTYYVNTSKLAQRPLWELPALTAHEAVPGHHHQISFQQEVDLPMFRKHAVLFTAYAEGWGLYAEYLGEEMGLYDTPEKMMGRLSYEAWRASRLVVDTGIHAMGWDKAKAVAYMRENAGLTEANIDAEVNRYISWPGQALGYKIGEIRIRELRQQAEAELGPRFDLREFHDILLSSGSVPLEVLSDQVRQWIAATKSKAG